MLLNGKWAVITGCNRGIGKAMPGVFSANGTNIWACVTPKNLCYVKKNISSSIYVS